MKKIKVQKWNMEEICDTTQRSNLLIIGIDGEKKTSGDQNFPKLLKTLLSTYKSLTKPH